MKLQRSRLFTLALTGLMVGGLLFGCGKHPEKKREVKITFWEWWADQQSMFESMAKEYEEETGVKVAFELSAPVGSDYFNKLQASANANTLPDIIGLAGGGELLARYIRAGRIYEMTGKLNADTSAWRNTFFPRALKAFHYEEGNAYEVKPDTFWGVPISVMNIQIYYNKQLFKKAGLDPEKPPATWDEFLEAGDQLNRAGIPPFLVGFGDLWIDYTFFNAYCWTYLGEEKMRKLYSGTLPYTDPGCVSVLERVVDMQKKKILYPGAVSMSNKDAEINFANQKAAMMLNGSWAVNVYLEMNSELELGVFPFPKPEDAAHPMYLIGGVGKGCAVTNNSENPEEAVAFLRWFLSKEQQVRLAKESKQIPANFQAMDEIDPLLKDFAKGMRNLTPDLKMEEKYEVREVISKGMQSILIGKSDPEKVLKQAWKTKQKVMAK